MELFEIVVVDTVCNSFKSCFWDVKGVEHGVFYALKLSISFRFLASAWQSSSLEAALVAGCLGTVGMSHSIGGSGTAAGIGGELNRAPAKRSTDWSLAESLAEFSRARNGEFFGVPQREENLRARGARLPQRRARGRRRSRRSRQRVVEGGAPARAASAAGVASAPTHWACSSSYRPASSCS